MLASDLLLKAYPTEWLLLSLPIYQVLIVAFELQVYHKTFSFIGSVNQGKSLATTGNGQVDWALDHIFHVVILGVLWFRTGVSN